MATEEKNNNDSVIIAYNFADIDDVAYAMIENMPKMSFVCMY